MSARPVIRLSARHKTVLGATLALLWTSGVLWLAFHYLLAQPGDFGPRPHALEAVWLKLHGAAALLALFVLGTLLPIHMTLAWQRNKNRRQGVLLGALFLWLTASGYALWYFASDDNAAWLPAIHWVAGLALPAALAAHVAAGRRRAAGRTRHAVYNAASPDVSRSLPR
jgi:hypothetical protein